MKKFIFIIALILMTGRTPASLFGSGDDDHQHRIQAEEQLAVAQTQLHQEHESTSRWQTVSMFLGVACPTLLIVGAILGASARRRHAKE